MPSTEYQRVILADQGRNRALAAALRALVRAGDTVVDIGAGSGFLSILAWRLGAKRCFCIERDEEAARLCEEMIRKNNVTGCTVIHGSSFDVRGIPLADLVLSETLGNFAYEENVIEILRDARRFLKTDDGRMCPQSLAQWVAPVVTDRQWAELASWDRTGFDMDWEPGRARTMNNVYVRKIAIGDLPGGDAFREWDRVDFRGKNASVRKARVEWQADRPRTVYGFALFWVCTLAPGIEISTSPAAPETHWQQIFLPLADPVTLARGEHFALSIVSDSRIAIKINVQWRVERISDCGKVLAVQAMDMRRG